MGEVKMHFFVLKTQKAVMSQYGFEYNALLPQYKYNIRGPFASEKTAVDFMADKSWGSITYKSKLYDKHKALEEFKEKERKGLLGYKRPAPDKYCYRPEVLGGVD